MPPLNEDVPINDDRSTASGRSSATKDGSVGPTSNERKLMKTVAELRGSICQMQMNFEELEQDRNFNAVKATELQMALEAFEMNEVHDALMTKSMQLADSCTEIDLLRVKLKKIEAEKQIAQKEREALSKVVRTLQKMSKDDTDDEDEDDEVVVTAENALEMTLKNMKFQVEVLEEERQRLAGVCSSQKILIDAQKQELEAVKNQNHLSSLRVAMLTQVIRDLNEEPAQQKPVAPQQTDEEKVTSPEQFAKDQSTHSYSKQPDESSDKQEMSDDTEDCTKSASPTSDDEGISITGRAEPKAAQEEDASTASIAAYTGATESPQDGEKVDSNTSKPRRARTSRTGEYRRSRSSSNLLGDSSEHKSSTARPRRSRSTTKFLADKEEDETSKGKDATSSSSSTGASRGMGRRSRSNPDLFASRETSQYQSRRAKKWGASAGLNISRPSARQARSRSRSRLDD